MSSRYVYSVGDDNSSTNYRPAYCDRCAAETKSECRCEKEAMRK